MNEKEHRDKFDELLIALAAAYRFQLSDAIMSLYFVALEDLSYEQFVESVNLAARSCKFFPKPAELREFIFGTTVDQGEMAWRCFWQAYLKGGYWNSVVFEDPAIAQTIAHVFGGWIAASEQVHTLSPEMIQAKRKEFQATYRIMRRRDWSPMDGYLAGHFETENSQTIQSWTHGQLPSSQALYFARTNGDVEVRHLALDQHTARIETRAIQTLLLESSQKQIGDGDAPADSPQE